MATAPAVLQQTGAINAEGERYIMAADKYVSLNEGEPAVKAGFAVKGEPMTGLQTRRYNRNRGILLRYHFPLAMQPRTDNRTMNWEID